MHDDDRSVAISRHCAVIMYIRAGSGLAYIHHRSHDTFLLFVLSFLVGSTIIETHVSNSYLWCNAIYTFDRPGYIFSTHGYKSFTAATPAVSMPAVHIKCVYIAYVMHSRCAHTVCTYMPLCTHVTHIESHMTCIVLMTCWRRKLTPLISG